MKPHRTTCRVIYADTDTMGYAYHANYLRWFEIGRTELFRSVGLPYREIERRGTFLPVSEAHCRFQSPVRYDDLLIVETTVDPKVRGGMKFDYRLLVEGDERLCATGYTRHACVGADGRVSRPPAFLMEAVRELLIED
ncbi:MAG: acyl-CoA thioesterase [Desulfobacteraceae bacterium]|nr:acyl-CoA thioesterase [Desulfobacteraceae bacterium]